MNPVIKSLINFLFVAIIVAALRSPVVTFVVGFSSGIAVYHAYPEKTEKYIKKIKSEANKLLLSQDSKTE